MLALRNIHSMLVPGGALLDLQPIPPGPSLHAGGALLGRLDQSDVWERFGKTEAGVEAAVREGLFELGGGARARRDRALRLATLIATIVERDDWHMSEGLAAGLASAEPPIDGRDHVRLRMFRAAASLRA